MKIAYATRATSFDPEDESNAQEQHRRVNGRWRVSPLREAGTLLGVLKQEGLAGKGHIHAFEKWLPRIVGVSRADADKVYREQTGREMADKILIQKADKIVRYSQLPPEAEVFRQIILKSRQPDKQRNSCQRAITQRKSDKREPGVTALYKVRVEVRSGTGDRDSTVLVGAQERGEAAERARSQVADFFGVPAKAVSAVCINDCPLEEFLVIDGYVMQQGWSADKTLMVSRRVVEISKGDPKWKTATSSAPTRHGDTDRTSCSSSAK